MLNVMLVGGTYNESGGKASGLVRKCYEEFVQLYRGNGVVRLYNGGTLQNLKDIITEVKSSDIVYWFANVNNAEEKLIKSIKEINNKVMLIESKVNNGKYEPRDIVAHILKNKANLCVEMITSYQGMVIMKVLDPLGNMFANYTADYKKICSVVYKRVEFLRSLKRQATQFIDMEVPTPTVDGRFLEIIRKHGETFTHLLNPANAERFLGNSSFRCMKGFPSFRDSEAIYVSRRNIDKSSIGEDGFVPIVMNNNSTEYFVLGKVKPSVDTPIQIRLYQYYPNISYMLHSHVYIEGAPFTSQILPCGAVEEFDEIVKLFQDKGIKNASINLLGHGSLAMTDSTDYFDTLEYYARTLPYDCTGIY